MTAIQKETASPIIPCLRYKDAPAAIKWLCQAFGFEEHLVVPDGEGGIAHAQLRFGNGMIMLGSIRGGDYGDLIRQPEQVGGETQTPYIIVDDADAHHARAKEAGAKIVIELADQDHGGRLYACRDPEGHIWNFGDYNPWVD